MALRRKGYLFAGKTHDVRKEIRIGIVAAIRGGDHFTVLIGFRRDGNNMLTLYRNRERAVSSLIALSRDRSIGPVSIPGSICMIVTPLT